MTQEEQSGTPFSSFHTPYPYDDAGGYDPYSSEPYHAFHDNDVRRYPNYPSHNPYYAPLAYAYDGYTTATSTNESGVEEVTEDGSGEQVDSDGDEDDRGVDWVRNARDEYREKESRENSEGENEVMGEEK